MQKKKRAGKRKKRRVILPVFFIFVLGVLLISMTASLSHKYKTEVALSGTVEDKISTSGYLIKKEQVVEAPADGIISFRISEGERIGKGTLAAVIYTGTVSREIQNNLTSINARIRDLESSTSEQILYAGDAVTTISQVVGRIEDVMWAVYRRDTASVTQYKDDITRLIADDHHGATSLTTLEQLRTEKKQLESSIEGNAVSLYAPEAGVMSSVIDGYESYFQYQKASELTPSHLRDAKELAPTDSHEIKQGEPCLKIVDNYSWYYAANLEERWVKNLKEGAMVSLRFVNITEEKIDGTVFRISPPENGLVTVVVESDQYVPGIYGIRKTEAELIRKTYSGFKIPKKALRLDEQDQTYVFINSEGIVRRRNVTVLFSDASYVIIKEDNSASNPLLLYDEVIVESMDLKEGDVL